jgi:hypothetical protein
MSEKKEYEPVYCEGCGSTIYHVALISKDKKKAWCSTECARTSTINDTLIKISNSLNDIKRNIEALNRGWE